MYLSPRHEKILEVANNEDRVFVDDLAARFDVTPQTIRKDLNDLCNQRLLMRIHGGAELPSGVANVEYDDRRQIAALKKPLLAGWPLLSSQMNHLFSSILAQLRRP